MRYPWPQLQSWVGEKKQQLAKGQSGRQKNSYPAQNVATSHAQTAAWGEVGIHVPGNSKWNGHQVASQSPGEFKVPPPQPAAVLGSISLPRWGGEPANDEHLAIRWSSGYSLFALSILYTVMYSLPWASKPAYKYSNRTHKKIDLWKLIDSSHQQKKIKSIQSTLVVLFIFITSVEAFPIIQR